MIQLQEDNTIICGDGAVLNDRTPETVCEKALALRAVFPYLKDYESPKLEEVLSFNGKFVLLEIFPMEDGQRVGVEKLNIFPLDDVESDKAKKFCEIVFTDEVKREFIASLPRVEVENVDERQRKVSIPVMVPDGKGGEVQKTEMVEESYEAHEALVGNVLKKIPAGKRKVEKLVFEVKDVIDEDGNPVMERYKTGDTTTFILYKDNLYPGDWDGTT